MTTDRAMNELTLPEYLAALAGPQPAPGGGSAAALAGALAAACAEMVANFTVGRKKYAAVEEEMQQHLQALATVRAELLELVQADVAAFSAVRAAYALPKEDEAEQAAREAAIQGALRAAAEVPLRLARLCAQLADQLPPLVERGNRNLASDAGVAAALCRAVFDCAVMNVEVNLSASSDREFALRARIDLDALREPTHRTCRRVWAQAMDAVRGG